MNDVTAAEARMPNPLAQALWRLGIERDDFAKLTGELGATPKETIYAHGTLKLHHYRPQSDELYRVPVLVVTSLVNQPSTSTNGCVLVEPVQLGFCLSRL